MLARTFGKRVVGVSNRAAQFGMKPVASDPADETRIFPKAVWDGPHGDTLRQLGFLPDDPANLVLTPQRGTALMEAATARMNRMIASVEAHVRGLNVRPWAMIPWSAWEGLNAEFLIRAEFLPSSPWNNMILPMDEASSHHLELPLHPQAAVPGLHETVTRLITELRLEHQEKIAGWKEAFSRGDCSFLGDFQALKDSNFKKLFMMARYVSTEIFGSAAIAQHDELFGMGLSDVPG